MKNKNSDEVVAYEAERSIRKMIGYEVKLDEIFTEEKIANCQKQIDSARDDFYDVAQSEIAKLKEVIVIFEKKLPNIDVSFFQNVANYTSDINGHAQIFNFGLITSICMAITRYCKTQKYPPETRYRVIADLVKLLRIVARDKFTDANGAISEELKRISDKYRT